MLRRIRIRTARAMAASTGPSAARLERTLMPQAASGPARATNTLFARLGPGELAEVQDGLTEEDRATVASLSELDVRRFYLGVGLRDGTGRVAERTGLSPAVPPPDVHSMTRGDPRQIGGAYQYADLLLDWLHDVNADLPAGSRALDFSCSSGRVVRVLAAARPDVQWIGCDPNERAIAWASEHLPAADFFVSPMDPPLPLEDGSINAALALSVWSHFSAEAAIRWLNEMHRLIRPGGHLLLSTHGLNACRWFEEFRDPHIDQRLGLGWPQRTAAALERSGHRFWDVFGADGDHGLHDPDWGLAFFTPEWLLEHATPTWSVVMYRLGWAGGNQDVYALRREGG